MCVYNSILKMVTSFQTFGVRISFHHMLTLKFINISLVKQYYAFHESKSTSVSQWRIMIITYLVMKTKLKCSKYVNKGFNVKLYNYFGINLQHM